MSIREFRGDPGEVGFLEFFFRNARALKTASVSMANPSFTPFSAEEAHAKVKYSYRNKASKSCQTVVRGSTGPSGGEVWRFKDGADFSFHDPFSQLLVSRA
uniref:FBD domain-containing protein n=1 Tax=Aegilops tauschii subsp. strangulata TaxID=200361 RepID=A0A453AHS8_AEGTS